MYTTVSFTEMTDEYFTMCLFESVCFKGLLLRRRVPYQTSFPLTCDQNLDSPQNKRHAIKQVDHEDTENDHQEQVIKVIDIAILPTLLQRLYGDMS